MMKKTRSLHCIGIGGIGVSAIARHFVHEGWSVTGCDLHSTKIEGVTVFSGQSSAHIDETSPSLVVYSPALPSNHPELLRVRELGISCYSYPQALGLLGKSYKTIAVSGTHGKSTTTALLSHMFIEEGKDPIAIVGAKVPGFEENYRPGKGEYFIVEGCEYKRGMIDISPESTIVTNIEADHLDYYKDIDDVQSAFETYVSRLPEHGVLVYNNENEYARHLPEKTPARRAISFGLSHEGGVYGRDIQESEFGVSFTLMNEKKSLGVLTSVLPGLYNVQNILAAAAMALAYGISFTAIERAVKKFTGIGRRFEQIGTWKHIPVFSDYAHHPTALHFAAQALEEKYKKKDVLIIFQPHQIDRTKKLAKDFVKIFSEISHLIVQEIYYVPGREEIGTYSAKTLVNEANAVRENPVIFSKTFETLNTYLLGMENQYDAILFVGAGDIDAYARKFLYTQNV